MDKPTFLDLITNACNSMNLTVPTAVVLRDWYSEFSYLSPQTLETALLSLKHKEKEIDKHTIKKYLPSNKSYSTPTSQEREFWLEFYKTYFPEPPVIDYSKAKDYDLHEANKLFLQFASHGISLKEYYDKMSELTGINHDEEKKYMEQLRENRWIKPKRNLFEQEIV